MANGIADIFKDKIFPTDETRNQTENGALKESLFSPPITKRQADAALNHITGQFVTQQNSANRATAESSIDDTKKTASDFFIEILERQPLDYDKLAKQPVSVVMKATKPVAEMTLADYIQAKDRAIYKQAGYAMLTEAEVRTAADMVAAKFPADNKNFGLDNLRKWDSKAGDMILKTDKATIEYAARAGQAMLQYRDYKAKQTDANQKKAQTEVNRMFADQARVLWNSTVNIAEGAVNTALDAATTGGGTNPLPLLNPNRPQVDFSGAKTDYRSEMMRRDLNGKLGGDGIKAGQFIETGVTIAAPIVIGAATTPKAAPQSLKTLGGIPEVEVSTAQTISQTAPKVGKLEIEQGRKLSASEQRFADKMAGEGKVIKARKEINQQGVKNPDFEIDNEIIEFKYVSDLKGTNADKLSGGLSRRILDGKSQASKVALDVSDQAGMTKEVAQRAIKRAFGNLNDRGASNFKEVRIYGKDFDITVSYSSPKPIGGK